MEKYKFYEYRNIRFPKKILWKNIPNILHKTKWKYIAKICNKIMRKTIPVDGRHVTSIFPSNDGFTIDYSIRNMKSNTSTRVLCTPSINKTGYGPKLSNKWFGKLKIREIIKQDLQSTIGSGKYIQNITDRSLAINYYKMTIFGYDLLFQTLRRKRYKNNKPCW